MYPWIGPTWYSWHVSVHFLEHKNHDACLCVQIMIKNKRACICVDPNLIPIQTPIVSGLHSNQAQ